MALTTPHTASTRAADRCRRKFLRIFPEGFADATYLAWERDYKWAAHRAWLLSVGRRDDFARRLAAGEAVEIAQTAVRIESGRPLLYSFEKMALRDAVIRSRMGAEQFAHGLYDWMYGPGSERRRFEQWAAAVAALPKRQRRVASWPVVTVFGFIVRPRFHFFVKPMVMRRAAAAYGFELEYSSHVSWSTYESILRFASVVADDIADLGPRDQIDVQSFLWVQGSDEYE
jgi:hypothetical protein